MAGKNKKNRVTNSPIAAQNRKARHNYEIMQEYEAGICLTGTEVKSLRAGKANIIDSYADAQGSEIFLLNVYIPEYGKASSFMNHNPKRARKLLLHKKEIKKLIGQIQEKGFSLIALDIHFNEKGVAKVKLGLGKGKSNYDKRETEKSKDWDRKKARVMKGGDE